MDGSGGGGGRGKGEGGVICLYMRRIYFEEFQSSAKISKNYRMMLSATCNVNRVN